MTLKLSLNSDKIPTAVHHLVASLILMSHQMIMKHPQNRSLKCISIFLLASGQQRKLMKAQFWQQWRSSIYQISKYLPIFLFLSTAHFSTPLQP